MAKMGFEKQIIRRKYGNIPVNADIGGKTYHFRCKLEYRWAQHLQLLYMTGEIKSWEYETHCFQFEDSTLKRYLIDFTVRNNDDSFEYYECKGMVAKYDIDRLRLVYEQYPDTKITIVFASKPKLSAQKRGKLERYCHRIIYNANSFLKKEPIDFS